MGIMTLGHVLIRGNDNCDGVCNFLNCENLRNSLYSKLYMNDVDDDYYMFGDVFCEKMVNNLVHAKAHFMQILATKIIFKYK